MKLDCEKVGARPIQRTATSPVIVTTVAALRKTTSTRTAAHRAGHSDKFLKPAANR